MPKPLVRKPVDRSRHTAEVEVVTSPGPMGSYTNNVSWHNRLGRTFAVPIEKLEFLARPEQEGV